MLILVVCPDVCTGISYIGTAISYVTLAMVGVILGYSPISSTSHD